VTLFRLCLVVGVVLAALNPNCAATQKTATITPIDVTTSCNAWVWVRDRGHGDGQPIIGASVTTQTQAVFTDSTGYACLWLNGPTLTRIHAGTNFQGWEGMLWPSTDAVEVRLSWVSRANH
jgi:hypothetical protein